MNRKKIALRKFYEQVGQKYPEEKEVYRTLRGILRKKFVLSYLSRFSGSLLDIGCNRGMYLEGYNGGARFGVDLSLSVLKKTHRTKEKHLVVADAERLQCFKSESFDNILCSEVLEHCLNPVEVFKGIAHSLRPNGYALLTTPNYKRKKPTWIGLGTLTHFGVKSECPQGYFHTAYTPGELAEMAGAVGLDVVETGTLEKEVKYAAKIPAAILLLGRALNRFFQSEKFDQANEKMFNQLSLWIYAICHKTGLERILLNIFTEGVRSYVLMQKSDSENVITKRGTRTSSMELK